MSMQRYRPNELFEVNEELEVNNIEKPEKQTSILTDALQEFYKEFLNILIIFIISITE